MKLRRVLLAAGILIVALAVASPSAGAVDILGCELRPRMPVLWC